MSFQPNESNLRGAVDEVKRDPTSIAEELVVRLVPRFMEMYQANMRPSVYLHEHNKSEAASLGNKWSPPRGTFIRRWENYRLDYHFIPFDPINYEDPRPQRIVAEIESHGWELIQEAKTQAQLRFRNLCYWDLGDSFDMPLPDDRPVPDGTVYRLVRFLEHIAQWQLIHDFEFHLRAMKADHEKDRGDPEMYTVDILDVNACGDISRRTYLFWFTASYHDFLQRASAVARPIFEAPKDAEHFECLEIRMAQLEKDTHNGELARKCRLTRQIINSYRRINRYQMGAWLYDVSNTKRPKVKPQAWDTIGCEGDYMLLLEAMRINLKTSKNCRVVLMKTWQKRLYTLSGDIDVIETESEKLQQIEDDARITKLEEQLKLVKKEVASAKASVATQSQQWKNLKAFDGSSGQGKDDDGDDNDDSDDDDDDGDNDRPPVGLGVHTQDGMPARRTVNVGPKMASKINDLYHTDDEGSESDADA